MKKEIKAVATRLILENGKTTNLDVKNQLRDEFPTGNWTQKKISKAMHQLVKEGKFSSEDLGSWHEFTHNSTRIVEKKSRTKVIDDLKGSGGKFVTVLFEKNDKTTRMIYGKVHSGNFMNTLGYINFHSSKGGIKQIDPKKIIALKTKGTDIIVK
jgi:hypothetical protein